jgi:hypothetical protein
MRKSSSQWVKLHFMNSEFECAFGRQFFLMENLWVLISLLTAWLCDVEYVMAKCAKEGTAATGSSLRTTESTQNYFFYVFIFAVFSFYSSHYHLSNSITVIFFPPGIFALCLIQPC